LKDKVPENDWVRGLERSEILPRIATKYSKIGKSTEKYPYHRYKLWKSVPDVSGLGKAAWGRCARVTPAVCVRFATHPMFAIPLFVIPEGDLLL
jgi:hypothetical protein